MRHHVKVTARFVDDATGEPLEGGALRVRLLDRDALKDDLLGEAAPDDDGRVSFVFDLASASSWDSPRERRPDLYMELVDDGRVRYETRVWPDVDFLKPGGPGGLTNVVRDLGTVRVG